MSSTITVPMIVPHFVALIDAPLFAIPMTTGVVKFFSSLNNDSSFAMCSEAPESTKKRIDVCVPHCSATSVPSATKTFPLSSVFDAQFAFGF